MKKVADRLKGFTLIEVLVVIALIAILAAITIIAINPQENFEDAEDTERSSEVLQLVNAITQYTSEQGNALSDFQDGSGTPLALNSTNFPCDSAEPYTGSGATTAGISDTAAVGVVDMSALAPTYIAELPTDPDGGNYNVCVLAGGRVAVGTTAANEGIADGGNFVVEAIR